MDAGSIVRDLQKLEATLLDKDLDGCCLSINCILKQFLNLVRACKMTMRMESDFQSISRPLNDFTSSNTIDNRLFKLADSPLDFCCMLIGDKFCHDK